DTGVLHGHRRLRSPCALAKSYRRSGDLIEHRTRGRTGESVRLGSLFRTETANTDPAFSSGGYRRNYFFWYGSPLTVSPVIRPSAIQQDSGAASWLRLTWSIAVAYL